MKKVKSIEKVRLSLKVKLFLYLFLFPLLILIFFIFLIYRTFSIEASCDEKVRRATEWNGTGFYISRETGERVDIHEELLKCDKEEHIFNYF